MNYGELYSMFWSTEAYSQKMSIDIQCIKIDSYLNNNRNNSCLLKSAIHFGVGFCSVLIIVVSGLNCFS